MTSDPTHSSVPEYQCSYCKAWVDRLYIDPAWRDSRGCCRSCAGDRIEAQFVWWLVVLVVLSVTVWAMVKLFKLLASS